jgi:hypothetical protein
LPLFSKFASEYVIRKVLENKWKLKLNETHYLLAHADDVDLLGDNIDTTKKKTEISFNASKEVSFEGNAEKTK